MKKLICSIMVALTFAAAPAMATQENNGNIQNGSVHHNTTVQGGTQEQGQSQGQHQGQSSTNVNVNSAQGGKGGNAKSTSGAVSVSGATAKGGRATASGGQAFGGSSDNSVSISERVRYEAPASAPAVFAPALAVAPETCMGSTSIGTSGSNGVVGFGLNVGTTWKSESCERRMYARSFQQLGETGMAVALLCGDPMVRAAARSIGSRCPGDVEPVAEAIPAARPSVSFAAESPRSEEVQSQ